MGENSGINDASRHTTTPEQPTQDKCTRRNKREYFEEEEPAERGESPQPRPKAGEKENTQTHIHQEHPRRDYKVF